MRPRDLRDQSLLQFTTLRIGRAAELAMSATAFLLATRASPWLGVSLGTEVAR